MAGIPGKLRVSRRRGVFAGTRPGAVAVRGEFTRSHAPSDTPSELACRALRRGEARKASRFREPRACGHVRCRAGTIFSQRKEIERIETGPRVAARRVRVPASGGDCNCVRADAGVNADGK